MIGYSQQISKYLPRALAEAMRGESRSMSNPVYAGLSIHAGHDLLAKRLSHGGWGLTRVFLNARNPYANGGRNRSLTRNCACLRSFNAGDIRLNFLAILVVE